MALSENELVIGPRVPRGLAPAVEGLAREILRHRPQDIYTFAARHFEQLIELRETEQRASVNISKIFDRAPVNRKCRVLVDWIGSDGKCQPVSDGGSNHDRYRFSVRKVHDSIEETRQAIKETTGTLSTISTKLLAKRRRRRAAGGEAVAANRNGWSINETAKVFKKHACYENKPNNANWEKSKNTEKSTQKKSIERNLKEIHSYFEQRSPRLSKTIAHCRFHRSWSVEDMHLAKNSSRRFKENGNQVEPAKRNRGSIELSATSRLENDARTYDNVDKSSRKYSVEKTENTAVRCLKRQKSAGQVEDVCSCSLYGSRRTNHERFEYIAAPRRTHSLVNVTSNGSYERVSSGKEETEDISNEIVQSGVQGEGLGGGQGRRESFRGKGIGGKQRKKSEEGVTSDKGVDEFSDDTREKIVVGKLNARLESDGPGSKDNERVGETTETTETFEYQFWSDSKGMDIVDDTNVIILREDTSDPTSKQEDSSDNQESVVLPSVIKKQGSNSRYSENIFERSENDTNYLVLPPISADASKPIKREDNLVLPVLSKLSEVIEIDREPLKSFDEDRVASIEDETEHVELDASVSESQTLQQVSDCDYHRSTEAVHRTPRSYETVDAARYETAQGTCTSMLVDRANENDEGSEVHVEMYTLEENCSNVTSDFVQVPQTQMPPSPPPSAESLGRLNVGNQKEETKEQENEKEDREEVENGNLTTMVADEQEDREKRRNMDEDKTTYLVGNDELKSKLIEIETVERNIENTLISSETVLIAEEDREPKANSEPESESQSESQSEKSSILFGNKLEASSVAGEVLQEEDDTTCDTKEDSLRNCFGKNDQTDTIPRKESNASTTVVISSSVEDDNAMGLDQVDVADDGGKSEPARHGSAGHHRLSENFSKDMDPSCYVLTEGSPCEIPESVTTVIIPDKSLELQRCDSDGKIFRFDDETIDGTPRMRKTFEQDANPFGEYIVHPAETLQYSTDNLHADFLRDIKDAVDRTLLYKDLGNIKEEEEEQEEEKCESKEDAMRDEKVVETCCTVDEATSDQLERNDTAGTENVPSDSPVCKNEGREGATLEDSKCEQPLFSVSDTVIEPCVPELDLDSFRDATLSSVEDGSDSINVENLSGKDERFGDGDVVCEPDITSASFFDPMSPKRKATIEKNRSSDSRPNPDRFQDENATTSSHDSNTERRDSSNLMEEEIARELIENLTGEASTLEETTDQNTAEPATDSFDRNDNIPSEHVTVSTATVATMDMDIDMHMDGNTRDESEVNEEKEDSVASSRSVGTLKNRNISELSRESVNDPNLRNKSLETAVGIIQFHVREFIRRRRNLKKSDKEQDHRQDSPDTSVVRKATLSLPRENIQLRSKQSFAIPNDGCCDEEKWRESGTFEAFEASILKTKYGQWLSTALPSTEIAETEQPPGKEESSICHGSRHTGEFHDSLPLLLSVPVPVPVPISEISKNRLSPMNATVHALERIDGDAAKPLLTLKPDTSSFHNESPETENETETETCVLLTFDLPKSLQLIENASNWSTSCVNLPSYTVRIEHDFDADKANVDYLAGERFDADDIREPLALDRTSNTILIEEILAEDEEEKERLPTSRSDNAVDEYGSNGKFTFEHINVDSEDKGHENVRET